MALRADAGVRRVTVELLRGRRVVARQRVSVRFATSRLTRVHVLFRPRSVKRLKAGRYGVRVTIRGIDRVLGANVTLTRR